LREDAKTELLISADILVDEQLNQPCRSIARAAVQSLEPSAFLTVACRLLPVACRLFDFPVATEERPTDRNDRALRLSDRHWG